MAEEKRKPLTRKDVLRLIKEHGGPEGLDLPGKVFEEAIDLSGQDLHGIILSKAIFPVHFERGKPAGANLKDAHLEGARLWHAHLENAYLFDAHLEKANLRGIHLERADLSYANLEGTDLTGAHLEGASLTGVRLSSDTKLHNVHWGKNYILAEESHGPLDWAEDTYRTLKMWHTQAGIYNIAAKFYYREKEANRKTLKWRSKNWHHRLALELLRTFFGYGEHWERILFWMALVVFGSAVAYLFGGLNLPYSLYFSVVSFTALGYGKWVNITPQGWVQALGAFQSFSGVFLMALFLVTFIRKMTR